MLFAQKATIEMLIIKTNFGGKNWINGELFLKHSMFLFVALFSDRSKINLAATFSIDKSSVKKLAKPNFKIFQTNFQSFQ